MTPIMGKGINELSKTKYTVTAYALVKITSEPVGADSPEEAIQAFKGVVPLDVLLRRGEVGKYIKKVELHGKYQPEQYSAEKV